MGHGGNFWDPIGDCNRHRVRRPKNTMSDLGLEVPKVLKMIRSRRMYLSLCEDGL